MKNDLHARRKSSRWEKHQEKKPKNRSRNLENELAWKVLSPNTWGAEIYPAPQVYWLSEKEYPKIWLVRVYNLDQEITELEYMKAKTNLIKWV